MWLFSVFISGSSVLSDYPFYCPLDTTGFYTIDLNANLSFDLTNYCPLSTGSYYDVNYLQNKTFDTTNYCPLLMPDYTISNINADGTFVYCSQDISGLPRA